MAFDFEKFGEKTTTTKKGGFDFNSFGESEEVKKEEVKKTSKLGAIANFLGVKKFGEGIGQTLANKSGVQDKVIQANNASIDIQTNLLKRIKENKAVGKDTSKLEQALKDLTNQIGNTGNQAANIGTNGLTNKEVLGSALNTGALFIPGAPKGSSLLTKAAVGGGTGYAFDVANNLQKNKEGGDIFTPGLGTALGTTLPVLTTIFGKGAKLEQISERLTPTEKKNLGAKGKEVAQYIVDKRIAGSPEQRLAKINSLYTDMESKVQDVVNKSNTSFPKQPVIEGLQAVKKQFLNEPAEYKGVSNKIDEVVSFLQEHASTDIPTSQLNKYKRSLADSAYSEKGNKVLSEGLKAASDVLKDILDKSVPGLQLLNKEYSKIITARGLLKTATTRSQAGLMEKSAAFLAGSAMGGSVGGLGGASAGAFLGPKLANATMTPLRSGIGVGLNEVNRILEKIPESKVGNLQLSKKALIKLLTSE